MNTSLKRPLSRRAVLGIGVGTAAAWLVPGMTKLAGASPAWQGSDAMTIDLAVEPATLDPALVYESDGWSVIHSIYDSLVQFGPDGSLQMVLAESMTQTDPLTWEITLRPDVTFHNGEPFDAAAVAFSVTHILDPATKSQVAGNFAL